MKKRKRPYLKPPELIGPSFDWLIITITTLATVALLWTLATIALW